MAENEIIATARSAKVSAEAAAKAIEATRDRRWRIGPIGLGVGVGIGSAAIAAAVIFARRTKD